jgi:fructuronate reductase
MSSETPKNHVSEPEEGDFRLSTANLDRLPGQIRRPAYDRAGITPGIVHL